MTILAFSMPWKFIFASFALREPSDSASVAPTQTPLEPSFRRMMVYIFVGSRGGQNRARIVEMLRGDPSNPNKISEKLQLDYKTVQHHIRMLEQNGVIVASSKGSYGAVYFLTPYFEKHFDTISTMWARFGQSQI